MNINNLSNPQPTSTNTTRETPAPSPQLVQPGHPELLAVAQRAQHPQQSHSHAPPAPAHNPQWMLPQSLLPPPPEQGAFYTNYGSQWHGQQPQYHVLPRVIQPPPQSVPQPNYNSYQPTAGYPWYYVPQPVTSPQPWLAYYPHAQPQQQKCLHHTLLQDALPAKRQRFDNPNLNRQAQHHAPLSPQPQFEPPLPLARDTGVYFGQNQGPGRGNGRGTRGESMSGGGRRAGVDLCAHRSGGGAAIMQAESRNAIPTSSEPAAVPVAAQLQGAHRVNISGNTRFTNIGMNTGNLTTVNNYSGAHGLENFISKLWGHLPETTGSTAALHSACSPL